MFWEKLSTLSVVYFLLGLLLTSLPSQEVYALLKLMHGCLQANISIILGIGGFSTHISNLGQIKAKSVLRWVFFHPFEFPLKDSPLCIVSSFSIFFGLLKHPPFFTMIHAAARIQGLWSGQWGNTLPLLITYSQQLRILHRMTQWTITSHFSREQH